MRRSRHRRPGRSGRLARALSTVFAPLLAWLALTPETVAARDAATTAGPEQEQRDDREQVDRHAPARRSMVETIARYSERGPETIGPRVLEAMGRVPRHEFVPASLQSEAYRDSALPIGDGQTISQPYIVALMSELAAVRPGEKVLEVGTGSGYQAAVLAELGAEVFTIEIVEPLGRRAASTFQRLGLSAIHARIGDGYAGWPEHAPFDAILVTAAPERIPPPLVEQLAPGGRLVVPVGKAGRTQQLTVLDKKPDGRVERRVALPVIFVPLTRD